MERLIITIDGPAGTGKSSVARQLAGELALEFLDTGAMYRAATALAIDAGIDPRDEHAIVQLVRDADVHFDWTTDPPALVAQGRVLADRLRDPDVGALVSPISGLPGVRAVLVERQRRIGEAHPRLVSEGRDQGSVVFADADVKFYLDASPRVRARRRADQLRALGRAADPEAIERDLLERDRMDAERLVGPLVCPPGADRIVTDALSQSEVVARLARVVRSRVPEAALHEASDVPLRR